MSRAGETGTLANCAVQELELKSASAEILLEAAGAAWCCCGRVAIKRFSTF
jgi:hypothetical protein